MSLLLYFSDIKKYFPRRKSISLFDFNKKKMNENNFYYNDFLFNSIRKDKNFNKKFTILKTKIFNHLVKKLNSKHNYPKLNDLCWKVLLEPWLTNYISKNFYYWHLINHYKRKVKNYPYFLNIETIDPPIDTQHATELSDKSDEYNIYLLQRLCFYIFGKKKKLLQKKYFNDKPIQLNLENAYPKNNNIFIKFYNFIFLKLYINNRIIFDINKISLINKLKLNFKFFQLPVFTSYFFKTPNYNMLYKDYKNTSKSNRAKLFNFYKKKSLENYLLQNIFKDLPTCYVENFENTMQVVKNIKFNPKVIASDGRQEFNLYFKFWTALKISEGKKFVISDHGSSYISNLDDATHEESSHHSIRWFKYNLKNSVQLPIIQKLKKRERNYKLRENLIIICTELEKFPRLVLWSPIHNENLYQIKVINDIFKKIKKNIKKKIFIKLHPRINKPLFNNQISKYYLSHRKNLNIIDNQKKFQNIFHNSRLNVCLCPQTAFIESFLSGPTILIMNKDFYKIRDEFEKIHEELFKMNILFYDGKSALEHINKVWDDPQKWWHEKKIFNVRKKFENLVCKTNNKEEALKEWSSFFKKLL